MTPLLDRVFFQHPAKVDETYTEHLLFAWQFGIELIGAGLAALTHALVPCMFERTASDSVKRLYAMILSRSNARQMALEDPLAHI